MASAVPADVWRATFCWHVRLGERRAILEDAQRSRIVAVAWEAACVG